MILILNSIVEQSSSLDRLFFPFDHLGWQFRCLSSISPLFVKAACHLPYLKIPQISALASLLPLISVGAVGACVQSDGAGASDAANAVGHRKALVLLVLDSFLNDLHEGLSHAGVAHGRGLIELVVRVRAAPPLGLFGRDLSLVRHIGFVAHDNERESVRIAARVVDEALPPPVEVLEALLLRQVEDKAAAVGAAVEGVA